jgi:hypothetical protein
MLLNLQWLTLEVVVLNGNSFMRVFVYACIRLFGKCPRTARPKYVADRPAR